MGWWEDVPASRLNELVVEPFDVPKPVVVELGNEVEMDCWGISQKHKEN